MGKKKRSALDTMAIGAAVALVAVSVARELRTPPEDRTWQGRVAGVPYDWRAPSVDRLKSSWWAPDDDVLVRPTVFGIGWDVNLGRVARLAQEAWAEKVA